MSPDWRAVLFDLDGTLADTVELILRCYRHTMETHLGACPPDGRWLAGIGRPLTDQLEEFGRSREEAAEMLATYVDFQRRVHDGMVRPYPDAADVVDALRARGVRTGIVTSKRREMALRTLGGCGLADRVEVLVAADDVRRGKPDPEAVRAALEGLGVPAGGDVLFVGDSPFDVAAGQAAGVRTAAALWGPFDRAVLAASQPDWMLESLPEVLELRVPVDR